LMCQAPTGAGKTLLAAAIASGAHAKGNKLAFVVPRISLIDQTVEEFHKEGIDEVGVIQANHPMTDWSQPIQVCSIATLVKREKWPEAKVVLFDEGHELHKEHIAWMTDPEWKDVPIIGLSATPWTKGLGRYFDSLLVMSTTRELIDQGYLSQFQVFAASHPDLTGVKVARGDYVEGELSDAMQHNGLTADIVDTWKKRWGKGNTMVFAVDRAHAAALQARFNETHVTAAYQDYATPSVDRIGIKRAFHNGDIQVVCNVDTLTLGIDWDVRCLSLCRPTRSEIRYVQIIGRALRKAEGKDKAIILDHSDNTARMGFVTDIHYEHLDGGRFRQREAEKRVPLPKECPQCSVLMPVGTKTCPNCGFERKVVSKISEADGELVEYLEDKTQIGSPVKIYTRLEKQDFLSQVRGYARDLGKSEGWVSHTYRAKFGVWPNGLKHVQPRRAGYVVTAFIKERNIAYARKMARQREHVR
jgi:DNA repair protein RadD